MQPAASVGRCGPAQGGGPHHRLCAGSSSLVALKAVHGCGFALRSSGLGGLSLRRRALARGGSRVTASAAQPLVRAASRLVVRTLPANLVAGLFAAARRCVGV